MVMVSLIDYSAHAWHIISEMSHATEITTSRRGDVTNVRDKRTVLCPLPSLRGRRKKGRERGREKRTKEGKGKRALFLSPLPPSLFPYPLPFSTPATQAILCSFQIIEPVVAVMAGALDFTVCYDLTKVHFNSADCLNT